MADILPTIANLAGIELPADYVIDGHSFAPLLLGKPLEPRRWLFSYYADKRMLRTERWLLDGTGALWDCGSDRDERDYHQVSDDDQRAEVRAIRAEFHGLLSKLPGPDPDSAIAAQYRKKSEKQRSARQRHRQQKAKGVKKSGPGAAARR